MHTTEELNHCQAEGTYVSSPCKCLQHWVSTEPPRRQTFTSTVRVQCWRTVSCVTPQAEDACKPAPGSLQTWFLSSFPWLILLSPFAITNLSYMCGSLQNPVPPQPGDCYFVNFRLILVKVRTSQNARAKGGLGEWREADLSYSVGKKIVQLWQCKNFRMTSLDTS